MRTNRSNTGLDLLKGVVLGLLLFGIFGFIYSKTNRPALKTVPEIYDQYRATCRIIGDAGISTGVLLDTGFVLATAHGMDKNADGILQRDERSVVLEFLTEYGVKKINATVISIGNDWSIIQPEKAIVSKVSLEMSVPKIGTPVYTLGFPLGEGMHITKGYQSSRVSEAFAQERTSISAFSGNSGGGVFIEDGRSAGVLRSMRLTPMQGDGYTVIPIPRGNDFVFTKGYTSFNYSHVMCNWSEYTSCKEIYLDAVVRNLGHMLVIEELEIDYSQYKTMLAMFFQLWAFLIGVSSLRNELFFE